MRAAAVKIDVVVVYKIDRLPRLCAGTSVIFFDRVRGSDGVACAVLAEHDATTSNPSKSPIRWKLGGNPTLRVSQSSGEPTVGSWRNRQSLFT